MIQLNKYDRDQYFHHNFQCMTMLIYAFCKSCEPESEPEIVFVTKIKTKTFSGSVSGSQFLQNT
jgi:hypothetical protein